MGPYLCHLCWALSQTERASGCPFILVPILPRLCLSFLVLSLHPGSLTSFLVVPEPSFVAQIGDSTEHHLPQSLYLLQRAWKAKRGGSGAKCG